MYKLLVDDGLGDDVGPLGLDLVELGHMALEMLDQCSKCQRDCLRAYIYTCLY